MTRCYIPTAVIVSCVYRSSLFYVCVAQTYVRYIPYLLTGAFLSAGPENVVFCFYFRSTCVNKRFCRWTNYATGLSRKTTRRSTLNSSRKRGIFSTPPSGSGGSGSGGGTARRDTAAAGGYLQSEEGEEEGEGGGSGSGSGRGGGGSGGGEVTLVSRSTVRKEFTPVFGTGVVFYTSGAEVKGAILWGFPGEATTAAAAATAAAVATAATTSTTTAAADTAAGISARAVDLVRIIMERSANMQADLSDERVMQAWVQGLSDAARVVVQETGVGHLQPMRR